MPRRDLVPDPSAPGAAALERDGTIAGPFGGGLLLLFSERFRFVAGHDQRKVGERFVPHPLGRALVTGRKCLPWMHHPYVPHAILERDGDACDWLMVMGAFGPSHDWGDGTEADFPQYGIRRAARDRRGRMWEDGVALELALVGEDGGERRLSDVDWRLRHRPGLAELLACEPGPIMKLQLTAPIQERCGRVRVVWARRSPELELLARARFLARRLTVAPPEHEGAIDVLDAPFGFQRFEEHLLAPRSIAQGAVFDVPSLGVTLFLAADAPARARSARVDPLERRHSFDRRERAGGEMRGAGPEPGAAPAACFDVELRVRREAGAAATQVAFGVEDLRDPSRTVVTALRAPIDASARDLEGEEGREALRIESGDRWLDGLLRWSRHVAHALVAPNGVVMTGALGYSAKCHVGQDVPFLLPLFLLDPHPRLRGAARRMVEYLVESPSALAGRGLLDHPCEGQDFAFVPMRPRTARLWKRAGAAGNFRWILVLERLLACEEDRELAKRGFELFADKIERHYLPFAPERDSWREGEETQAPCYSLAAGYDGLNALLRLAEALEPSRAERLRGPIEAARAAIRAHAERPVEEGGLLLASARSRGGVTLEPGWLAPPSALERDPPWFGFDLPLVAAHALVHRLLSPEREARLADLLADPSSRFRVPGAGLAKSPGGEKGVWFWHNALAAKGLARAGRIDASHELFTAMARGVADINGLGIPGEELNGGDYAMAIGALAGLCLVESLLGLQVAGDRVSIRPRLPSALDRVALDGLSLRGRRFHVECTRHRPGPLAAAAAIEFSARTPESLTIELD